MLRSSRLWSQRIWSCVSSWTTIKLRSSSKPGKPQGKTKMSASLYVQVPKRGNSTVFTALAAGAFTMGLLLSLQIIDERLAFQARRRRVGGLEGRLRQRELRRGLGDVRVLDRGLRSCIIVRKHLKLTGRPGQVLDLLSDPGPRRKHLVDHGVDVADLGRQIARHADLVWDLEGFQERRLGRCRRHDRGRRARHRAGN